MYDEYIIIMFGLIIKHFTKYDMKKICTSAVILVTPLVIGYHLDMHHLQGNHVCLHDKIGVHYI